MSSDDVKSAMTPQSRIGFIGLGLMGGGMAMNILKKHGQLNVCDLDERALAPLLEAGAVRMGSPRALGAASDIVLTSLPDPAISKRVVLGAQGLIEGLAAESTVIGMSTDGIETVREIQAALAARHIRFVDCPVGKGPTAAVAGELQLFAAGDRETCDSLRWLLSMIGSKIDYCGPIGAGQAICHAVTAR
jgi:3-hydroxyisobutyrate dehydrogenase-like beta-hydroxyacid dehydrogenase